MNDTPMDSELSSKGTEAMGPPLPQIDDKADGETQVVVFTCPIDHDGATVHVKGWVRPGTTKPPIIIIHDLGEHVGLYRRSAKKLVSFGYSVYGFDLRGHGLSGHSLGHIPKFDALVNDLLQVVAWIRFKSNRRVPIIIGQGVGSMMSVYFQKAYPSLCQAIVLCAPLLKLNITTAAHKRALIRLLADIAPKIKLPTAMVPSFLSHISKKTEYDMSVSQEFRGVTAHFANELLMAINGAGDIFDQVACPMLLLCPEKDPTCDYTRLRNLVKKHPNPSRIEIKKLIDRKRHFLTEGDDTMTEALSYIVPWLDQIGKEV